MVKKLLLGCGCLSIGLVLVIVLGALFAVGASNEVDNVFEEIEQALDATVEPAKMEPTAEPIETVESVVIPEAPSEEEIHATLDQMTELARDEYLRSLHGLKFSMVGTVKSVDSGSHVSFSGTRFDARFRLSKEEAVALQLGQSLQITGMIESWETFLGLMVRLENVSIATVQ